MYGLIGRMRAVAGKRGELVEILNAHAVQMPGCRSYVVALDLDDADLIWVTEVWDSATAHKDSLDMPEVKQTIAKARPLIAGFDSHTETKPVSVL